MANEAVIVEKFADPDIRFTVASGNAITKGSLCGLVDPRTASGSAYGATPFAGIAAADKKAGDDSSTTLALSTKGIFDLKAGGVAINAGDMVVHSGHNEIRRATKEELSGHTAVVGKALETATAGEVIQVAVGLY